MQKLQMVDLHGQYLRLKSEIDQAMERCISASSFIKGEEVSKFEEELSNYLGVKHVISCGNGTDALQLALMALEIGSGDEVIIPSFNFVASAEAVAILGATPVFVDVNPMTFDIDPESIKQAINSNTKAVIAVHLFGQCCALEEIKAICDEHELKLIEDNAQAIGAKYTTKNGEIISAGTIGDIATTSFFPSKNLGAMGDGGACYTNNDLFAEKIRLFANHGQPKKYTHTAIGINSRLDGIQAAILRVKLGHLDDFILRRQAAAKNYQEKLKSFTGISLPHKREKSTHVYHQFTLCVENRKRDKLKSYLAEKQIPTMVYYPNSLHQQPVYQGYHEKRPVPVMSEKLSLRVLSLPMHTELKNEQIDYIAEQIITFLKA